MIVIDTAALVGIVFGEPEREAFVDIIQKAPRALIVSVRATTGLPLPF